MHRYDGCWHELLAYATLACTSSSQE